MIFRRIAIAGLFLSVTLGSGAILAPAVGQEKSDVSRKATTLLLELCIDCHGGAKPKGNLDLTREKTARLGGESGPAIVPGKVDDSVLWQRVESGDMPPKKPLSAADKALVRAWILEGGRWADDPIDPFKRTTSKRAGVDWWSLQTVVHPNVPVVTTPAWNRNPIDRFLLAKLEGAKLAPSPEADRRTLIRRLSYDLVGLPPTAEEVEAFAQDQADDAYEKLVDRLLESPHYGERWARHWLDVVRFGETDGFERNGVRRHAWPYRDWVIAALNADMPYDDFCRLQVAGDLLRPDDMNAARATGYLVAGIHNTVVPNNPKAQEIARHDELEDLIGNIGQTFLGLTINCARCHDHKFDPITQTEYYRMVATLGGVTHGERTMTPSSAKKEIDQLTKNAAELRRELTAIESTARQAVSATRKSNGTLPIAPAPIAAWDFRKDANDRVGALNAKLVGGATLTAEGLVVDGKSGLARTSPLDRPLREKTLEAWVRLSDPKQRGGGVLSVQTADGAIFDAIVIGEREPGRWMAGSNNFQRTSSFQGPEETDAGLQPVHIAITYAADGAIAAYREGRPYGKAYPSNGPVTMPEGKTVVAFGVRHEPAGAGRMLQGVIVQARLYDRALSADEVAASAQNSDFISDAEIQTHLSPQDQRRRATLQSQIAALTNRLDSSKKSALVKLYAAVPRQPPVTAVLLRGQVTDRGEVVAPGAIESLSGTPANFGLAPDSLERERRLKLAEWLTHPNNPLFARVMVNRIWHHHFGTGLVETPNDFGFNGGRPSHPELLDWLATEFAERGYRLKPLHRLIVTSSAYRQTSAPRADGLRIDADNRLIWRKRPQRLDGESLRDGMLAVAGLLNREVGGRGFSDYKEKEHMGTMYFDPFDPVGPEFHRRSIYRFSPRGGNPGLLEAFDCPDPASAAPRRSATTTPIQTLALWNGAFALRMADALAKRAAVEPTVPRQVDAVYRFAFQRPPATAERERAIALVDRHGLPALCRAILNANEFLTVE